jgi:hypothetical protein
MIQVNESDVSPATGCTITTEPIFPSPLCSSVGAHIHSGYQSLQLLGNDEDDESVGFNLSVESPLVRDAVTEYCMKVTTPPSDETRIEQLETGLLQARKLLERITKQRDHYVREYRRVLDERNRYMSMSTLLLRV